MTVKAVLKDGIITALDHTKIQQFKAGLKEGDYVELSFKRWNASRSGRQNRYLHSLLNRWCRDMGDAMTDAKNMFCIERGIALPYLKEFKPPDWGGHFVGYHDKIYFRKSTKEYTTVEMKTLIDGIKVAMDENGIDYSDIEPEET